MASTAGRAIGERLRLIATLAIALGIVRLIYGFLETPQVDVACLMTHTGGVNDLDPQLHRCTRAFRLFGL